MKEFFWIIMKCFCVKMTDYRNQLLNAAHIIAENKQASLATHASYMPLADGCNSLYVILYFSVCVCNFTCRPDETYALVGTAKDLTLNPRSCAGGFIHAYKIAELIDGGYKLEFVHKVKSFAQYVYA